MVAVLAAPRPIAAQSTGPWFGRWALNVEQSTYAGPRPYRRSTCIIEPWQQDGLKSVCEMVRVRGGVAHIEWTGLFDGKDYPVQGVEEAVTYAYTRIDDHRYDVVIKLDGHVAARATVVVSPDGNTMTTVTTRATAEGTEVTRSVYERQGSRGGRER
jgi:hypothetical protein